MENVILQHHTADELLLLEPGVTTHLLHDQRVHHIKDVPRYPHSPVLCEERRTLKAER